VCVLPGIDLVILICNFWWIFYVLTSFFHLRLGLGSVFSSGVSVKMCLCVDTYKVDEARIVVIV